MSQSIARSLAFVSALALIAACSPKAPTPQTDTSAAAATPAPIRGTSAPDFVARAGANDMFEIQTSQVALGRSKNAEVKEFARMMVEAHTKSLADLNTAIAASGMTLAPPATLPTELQNTLGSLSNTSASNFDGAYVNQQVDAHQAALDLVQRYANDGDTPMIKTFAAALAPIVGDHLAKARALQGK